MAIVIHVRFPAVLGALAAQVSITAKKYWKIFCSFFWTKSITDQKIQSFFEKSAEMNRFLFAYLVANKTLRQMQSRFRMQPNQDINPERDAIEQFAAIVQQREEALAVILDELLKEVDVLSKSPSVGKNWTEDYAAHLREYLQNMRVYIRTC